MSSFYGNGGKSCVEGKVVFSEFRFFFWYRERGENFFFVMKVFFVCDSFGYYIWIFVNFSRIGVRSFLVIIIVVIRIIVNIC